MAKTKFNVYVTSHATGLNVSTFTDEREAYNFAKKENRRADTLAVQVWKGKKVIIKPSHPRLLLNL